MNCETVVVLDSVKITHHLRLEKVAVLDEGVQLVNGKLPHNKDNEDPQYCTYFRVSADNHSCGSQHIYDWSCTGLSDNTDELMTFILKHK